MKKCKKHLILAGICMLLFCIHMPMSVKAEKKDIACDIVFALDISGSMKNTDENRTAIETIKMVMDICDETDRVGLVAYNDTIAYCYDLTELNTKEERDRMKENVNVIEYKGETDIGLGLLQAVELLVAAEEKNNQMVVLLSDGKTDLENSNSGRTLEQSESDLQKAIELAKQKNIQIHTIGFAGEYLEDGDYLTMISAKAGGSSQIAASPLQLNQMLQNLIFSYKNGESKTTEVMETTGENQTKTIEFQHKYVKKTYISVLSIGVLYEIKTGLEESHVICSEKYAIIKCENPNTDTCSLQIKGEPGKKVIINVMEVKGKKPTKEPTATVIPTKLPTKQPITVTPYPVTDNKENLKPAVGITVTSIGLVTLIICMLIVYAYFGRKKREYPIFQGKLIGQFIDLKSKNESLKLEWNLADYPQEGVTLKELFAGANFPEDLPEIERLCFYPERNHKILLVHCMSGGVFLEEDNVLQNTPVKISTGDTIYVSFAENSSELELKYML